MAKRVYESDVKGVRRRGRSRKCWIDGVNVIFIINFNQLT